jgi:hypothetical protein
VWARPAAAVDLCPWSPSPSRISCMRRKARCARERRLPRVRWTELFLVHRHHHRKSSPSAISSESPISLHRRSPLSPCSTRGCTARTTRADGYQRPHGGAHLASGARSQACRGRLAVGLDRSRAPVCCLEGPLELDQGGL